MTDIPEMKTTCEFWDANPCGIHDTFMRQKEQRYAMEPWIPGELARIAQRHASVLEVGCGQGVDSVVLCQNLKSGSSYTGIDYSANSVETAMRNADLNKGSMNVVHRYSVGNAEKLDFADASFAAVYSLGVIHHTARPENAIGEVHRVLESGGTAYIALYKNFSMKVGVALLLRMFQRGLDRVFRTDRCIYRLLRSQSSCSRYFGTMFLECFGVPFMYWYTKGQILEMFSQFQRVELKCYGRNLGRVNPLGNPETRFGYFWWVEATK